MAKDIFIPSKQEIEFHIQTAPRLMPSPGRGDWKVILGVYCLILLPSSLCILFILFPFLDDPSLFSPIIHPNLAIPIIVTQFFLIIMTLLTYYLSCAIRPKQPPKFWEPPKKYPEIDRFYDPVRKDNLISICEICQVYQPPRTRHCRQCGVCSLRLDHHCLFTTQCVGNGNHKIFILFCIYATSASAEGFLLSLLRLSLLSYSKTPSYEEDFYEYFALVMIVVLTLPVIAFVGRVFSEQIFCIGGNFLRTEITMVVTWTKAWQAYQKYIGPAELIWPYYISFCHSLKQIFGSNYWLWFIPIEPDLDGTSFDINPRFFSALIAKMKKEKGEKEQVKGETIVNLDPIDSQMRKRGEREKEERE